MNSYFENASVTSDSMYELPRTAEAASLRPMGPYGPVGSSSAGVSPASTPNESPATSNIQLLRHNKRVGDFAPAAPANAWVAFRQRYREPLGEFIGTMILLIFGLSVSCQVGLSSKKTVASSQAGDYLAGTIASASGLALGIFASGGGHINPAITLMMVVYRKFPVKKALQYVVAQVLGALFASFIVYATYSETIRVFEDGVRSVPGTASLFFPFPADYVSIGMTLWTEILGTAMLALIICTATDKGGKIPSFMAPLVIFVGAVGLFGALGLHGQELNPARTIGPRIMAAIFYGGEVLSYRGAAWIYTALVGEIIGVLLGGLVYGLFIYTGDDSFIDIWGVSRYASMNRMRSDSQETKINVHLVV